MRFRLSQVVLSENGDEAQAVITTMQTRVAGIALEVLYEQAMFPLPLPTLVIDLLEEVYRYVFLTKEPISKPHQKDKEFAAQSWVGEMMRRALTKAGAPKRVMKELGRNSYPDFVVTVTGEDKSYSEGYEVKSLAHPGRKDDFDANSQVPRKNTRCKVGKKVTELQHVFYVFIRYQNLSDDSPNGSSKITIFDVIIAHHSLFNQASPYELKNKSIVGFGSYGDIKIRVRKMYIVPTPYKILSDQLGKEFEEIMSKHKAILVLPREVAEHLKESSPESVEKLFLLKSLNRKEAKKVLTSYTDNLVTGEVKPEYEQRDKWVREHEFTIFAINGEAFQISGGGGEGRNDL